MYYVLAILVEVCTSCTIIVEVCSSHTLEKVCTTYTSRRVMGPASLSALVKCFGQRENLRLAKLLRNL